MTRDPHVDTDPEDLAYIERNMRLGRMPGQFRIRVRYRRYATDWFDSLTASLHELGEIIDGTGWLPQESFEVPEDA